MTPSAPNHGAELARAALIGVPAGLISDLDGTLAPIVEDPTTARLIAGADELLSELARRLAVVAIVSGRAAADVRRILGDLGDELLIVGNHGLEWLAPGAAEPAATVAPDHRRQLEAVLSTVPALEGTEMDDKGFSVTIHYRRAPDPERVREQLLARLGTRPSGVELHEGRRSIELRIEGAADKGTAVLAIAERYALRGLVVAGDDLTDLDMFRAAAALERRGLTTMTVAVAGGDEVPRSVGDAADWTVASPADVVSLLRAAV